TDVIQRAMPVPTKKPRFYLHGFFIYFIFLSIYFCEIIFAAKYSLFMRAIFSREISLGHSTSQAPVLVQLPNPSSSICATMFITRVSFSTFPCGNKASWETFAETNNMAEPFLQVATQAPQPIHAAALKASSASSF